jgi:competence transcription factor ComK
MQLDCQSIEEFKELYLKEYKVKLTDQEAVELGMRLINFVKAVYGNDLPSLKEIDKTKKEVDN